MNAQAFERAVLNTRTLMESHKGHPIAAVRVQEKPWVSEHLSWMLAQMLDFHAAGKVDKAQRWLGFVQGCLACHGYPLEDLKRANMPEGETFDGGKV